MKLIRKNTDSISSYPAHTKRIALAFLVMTSLAFAVANNNLPFASAHKSSDADHIEFIKQFGTSDVDSAKDVFADSSGVYVVGSTDGTLPDQTSQGGRDAFIRKYNTDGDEIWTQQFGMSDFEDVPTDEGNGVVADSSGVYVVGETQHSLDEGGLDAFIRKYNTDGDEIWTTQFGTSEQDNAFAVSTDSSGVYVVGITAGEFEGETNEGGFDIFIRKYNTDGDEIWTTQFGTSDDSNDEARGVSADSSGVYVAGLTTGTFPGQDSPGGDDIFVRKYNTDGDEIWTTQFGTSEFDFVGSLAGGGISADSSGIYVAGQTSGTFPGQTSEGDLDAFLAKLVDEKEKDDKKKKKDHDDDSHDHEKKH